MDKTDNFTKDLTFIGAGPANVFAILELIKQNYKGKILLIEKGNSLSTRTEKEVVSGFGGAGAISDCKLSVGLQVGGIIPFLEQEEFDYYTNKVVDHFNSFLDKDDQFQLQNDVDFDTKGTKLTWLNHKTHHIGTDIGKACFYKMEQFIMGQPNIEVLFNTDVQKIVKGFVVKTRNIKSGNEINYDSKKVIVGTGQRGTLTADLIKKFKLETSTRPFQLGIRVQDERNEVYDEIIKANYDFKFVLQKEFDNGVKIKARTFCANSGIPAISREDNNGLFTSFNGHSYKKGEPTNLVNYGIIIEVDVPQNIKTNIPCTKQEQFDLCIKVNKAKNFEADNKKGRSLLEDFKNEDFCKNDAIEQNYPSYTKIALYEFIQELNKIVDLSKAVYFFPEAKFQETQGSAKYSENFETTKEGLFFVGDCVATRGIVKAAYTGMKAIDYILKANLSKKTLKS